MSQDKEPSPGRAQALRNVDIVAKLEDRRRRGNPAEQRLVDCLLTDLQFAASAAIADIAKRADVSAPTITRLARALGFDGVKEMRIHLAQALAVGGAYLRPSSQVNHYDNADSAVATICSSAHAALELMSVGLSDTDIESIVVPLCKADQILVYGTGGMSSMAAIELQNRLFRLGLHVTTHTDPQLQRMSASVVTDKTVVVGFSLSGRARSVRDAMAIAQQYGAHAIAVTSADSPLANRADAVVPVTFRENENLYMPSMARYALLAAVDILAISTATSLGPNVLENMRRVRQSLVSQDMTDPHFPIGD